MSDVDAALAQIDKLMGSVEPKSKERFTFWTAAQLGEMPPLSWRLEGILPTGGLATVFGPSGSGKSFVLIDMMAAIAEGREWFGRKTQPCRVLCLALEGKAGIAQRTQAWSKQYSRPYPENVRFMWDSFRLNSATDVEALVASIEGAGGFDMIAIDTLNRAAPNADENSSAVVSQLLAAAGKLEKAISGLVVLVHHTGKDESRGLRGHSSLYAAMDSALEIKRSGETRGWRLQKSKDGKEGANHGFQLTPVMLGEGDHAASSCVVMPSEDSAEMDDEKDARPETPNQKAVMARINLMLESLARDESEGSTDTELRVSVQDVVEQTRGDLASADPKRHTERAKAAIEWLVKHKLVKREGDMLFK